MSLNLEVLKDSASRFPTVAIASDDLLALIEGVQALNKDRNTPRSYMAYSDHYELNEVECACGYMCDSPDYKTSAKALRDHIRYFEHKRAAEIKSIKKRADKALEYFDFGPASC